MNTRLKPRKSKLVYSCTRCGAQNPKWTGQCSECGAWNSLVEDIPPVQTDGRRPQYGDSPAAAVYDLTDIERVDEIRTVTGFKELDRVLGGGLVQGSVILIGGDPGIGKSTLLIQALASLVSRLPSLYVTGEESLQQISLRAHRLGLQADKLRLLAETNVERILTHAEIEKPRVMVIDSIQTTYTEELQSAPGGVSQVRESAARLVNYAKQTGTALFLVGHVTKEGALAGPRILEHMVDTVLYFEGETGGRYRIIRAVKNRFGAVNEVGVFAMTERGLREVSNPSAIFLSRDGENVPGTIVMVTQEGSRPMLIEVQALVAESHITNPRRVSVGLDQNRLAMLLAVLYRHGRIALFNQDVFVNVVGGVRVGETAADLAVALAAVSSLQDRPLPDDLVTFGEIGLSGEIRPVQNGTERLREAARHGLKRAMVPKANVPRKPIRGMEVIAVKRLEEALATLGKM